MENGEAKEIARLMAAGFKEINDRLNGIQLERQLEKGFEFKEKIEANTKDIKEINEWRIPTNTTIINSRRIIWALAGTVGSLVVGLIIAIVVYMLSRIPR